MKWQLPEGFTPMSESIATNKDICPVCRGSGWELYESSVDSERVYGTPTMVEYAKKCTACKGIRKDDKDTTEVPPDYRNCDLYQFDFTRYSTNMDKPKTICFNFMNEFEKWVDENKGLYLWSKTPGSGKTYLACCILKSVLLRTQLKCRFITAIDYMNKVAASYGDKNQFDPSWIYRNCDLLVLDDLGAQMSKEWQQQEMFRLVNERLENRRPTIFTSNNDLEHLNLDARTINRIYKTSVPIHFPEESIRAKNGSDETMKFVSKILGA